MEETFFVHTSKVSNRMYREISKAIFFFFFSFYIAKNANENVQTIELFDIGISNHQNQIVCVLEEVMVLEIDRVVDTLLCQTIEGITT